MSNTVFSDIKTKIEITSFGTIRGNEFITLLKKKQLITDSNREPIKKFLKDTYLKLFNKISGAEGEMIRMDFDDNSLDFIINKINAELTKLKIEPITIDLEELKNIVVEECLDHKAFNTYFNE